MWNALLAVLVEVAPVADAEASSHWDVVVGSWLLVAALLTMMESVAATVAALLMTMWSLLAAIFRHIHLSIDVMLLAG